jgi:hypothetical protein
MSHLLRATLAATIGLLAVLPHGAEAAQRCPAPLEAWDQVELYFGRNMPGGGVVSHTEFRRFLAEIVTPRFPDGLTVLDGVGQFRNGKGRIVREPSKVLVLLVPDSVAVAHKLGNIAAAYKRRFRQESVLHVESEVCLGFR